MSAHVQQEDNGNRATVALVDAKVDGLKDLIRAEFKDQARRLDELAGLEPRVRHLEQDAVRRVGPIIDELRGLEKAVEEIGTRVDAIDGKAVSAEQVRVALAFEREQREDSRETLFTRRQTIIGLAFAGLILVLNVVQALHIP